MKILQIRGSNLASLAGEFNLDFESGPLAEAGLFAISGSTGAGKSTLLDALCLALYEKTPRLDTVSSYQITDVTEEVLGVNDPRNLLRRGTAEGFAEVRFIGSDGRRYRANWSVRRARRKVTGRLQNTDIEFIDEESNQPIGRTKGEILAAIERAVGLTFEQFRRSILLAQGDFAAFLKAKGDERSELLERMTGTAFYSAISMRAHAKAREIESALRMQEESANALQLLDPEARVQLELQLASLREQVESLGLQLAVLREQKSWWERHQTLSNSLIEAQGSHAAAEQQWSAAAERRQALADIDRVQPLRPLQVEAKRTVDECSNAERKLSEATESAASARAFAEEKAQVLEAAAAALNAHRATAERMNPDIQRARSLDQSIAEKTSLLNEAKARLEAARRRLSELAEEGERLSALQDSTAGELQQLQGWLESNARLVALAQSWNEGVLPQLQSFQSTSARWNERCAAVPGFSTAHEQAMTSLATAQEVCVAAEAATQTATVQVREAEAAETAHPANDINERRAAVNALRDRITALQGTRQQAQGAELALRGCRERISTAGAETDRGRTLSTEARAKLDEIVRQQQDNERLLVQLGLDAHRATLVEGDPCPLCGSTHHPGVGPLHETTAELEAQKRRLTARVRELQSQESSGQALQSSSADRIAELQEEVVQREAELQAAIAQWRSLAGEADPLADAAGEWLAELVRQRVAEEQAIADQVQAFDRVRKTATDARKARDLVSEKELHARTALDVARASEVEAKSRLDQTLAGRNADRQALDGVLSTLSASFGSVDGWQVELETDPAGFIGRWSSSVDQARRNGESQQRATNTLSDIQRQQGLLANSVQSTNQSASELQEQWTFLDGECANLSRERSELLQGRPVTDVEQELAGAQQQAETTHTNAQNADREAKSAAAARDAALHAATEFSAQSATARDSATLNLAEALVTAGIDAATLLDRLSPDAAWISHERTELNAIDAGRSNEATVVTSRTRELLSHEGTPAPAQALDVIAVALSEQEPHHASLNQQLGAQQTRLDQDNQNRVLGEQRARELEDARQQARIWQQLDILIGSADGRKFRKFAQSLTMELLLAHANSELKTLAPRYALQRVKAQDLELQVIDRDMGDEVRSTSSLSGGETFLVSLALALGLSSLASEKVRIESLFVDEGFGTLDPQTLEMALATLDSLQAAGRRVGLISHVPGLAERIGVQVLVERQGQGASTVRVVNGWS